jgi:hypothetical protein
MTDYEQLAFDAEAIRDTSDHWSILLDNRGYRLKTIIIENGLNQQATFECWASRNSDFSNSFIVGSSWNVAASTDTYETSDSYFPYMKIKATCATAPTTGSLTVVCEAIGD